MAVAGKHARLSLLRTGGLAGVPMQATLDTRDLAPAQAQEIMGALDNVDLARVGAEQDLPAGAADTFHYDLEVDRGDGSSMASFSERQVPVGLAPVVRTLMKRAQPAGRSS
jgi:hypothetical protein